MKKFDIAFTNRLKPKQGRILISDPFLGDEYFERSVVYICEHNEQGSFGFVLNNFIEVNLKELNENFKNIPITLSVGGPVDTEVMYFIHTLGDELNDSLHLSNAIFMGGDFEQLYSFLEQKHIENHEVRFFLGYSGWSAGQLEEEIANNAWLVAEVDSYQEIMEIKKDCWKYFMEKQGKKFKIMTNFPINPTDN